MDMMDVDCFLLAGRFTLLEQEPLDTFLPKCVERNVSIIIGGPYNSGILATDDRRQATYDYKPAPDHLWEKAQAIRRMCESHGVDPRAAALQYPLRHPGRRGRDSPVFGPWTSWRPTSISLRATYPLPCGAIWPKRGSRGKSRSPLARRAERSGGCLATIKRLYEDGHLNGYWETTLGEPSLDRAGEKLFDSAGP